MITNILCFYNNYINIITKGFIYKHLHCLYFDQMNKYNYINLN